MMVCHGEVIMELAEIVLVRGNIYKYSISIMVAVVYPLLPSGCIH